MSKEINNVELPSNWIGGEFYIQTCLLQLLESHFKNSYIGLTLHENIHHIKNILNKCKIIIVPGWMNDINEENMLYTYKNKLYSFTYFENHLKNMKCLTSHKFSLDITPLYYYVIPLKNNKTINFNHNVKGLLLGKCISHNFKNIDNILTILNSLKKNNIKLYSTLRNLKKMKIFPKYLDGCKEKCISASELVCNHESIELLGIIDPTNFRYLLQHCKYLLCLGDPRSPPTIIEALFSDCIIIAPSNQISSDLHENKNIYFTDNMSNNDIICLIQKIENNDIMFDKNYYPNNYTEESMKNQILKLM